MSTSKPDAPTGAEDWSAEIAELRRRQAAARKMGGADKVKIQKDKGKWTVRERIDALPSYDLIGKGLALVPEGRGVFARLTVAENLLIVHAEVVAAVRHKAVKLDKAALVQQQLQQAGDASGPGMRQHLVVHLALVAHGTRDLLARRFCRHRVGPGEDLVNVVHQLREGESIALLGPGDQRRLVGKGWLH